MSKPQCQMKDFGRLKNNPVMDAAAQFEMVLNAVEIQRILSKDAIALLHPLFMLANGFVQGHVGLPGLPDEKNLA